ncbi:MAG: L-serine ammonia-lyase, iron-sulfur-dependent, subunit alpha [Treponema sp.]|nr:L-serine ammonia-lyase, iron-sulfur-dependent, subunit alpha [Treponema sp.]
MNYVECLKHEMIAAFGCTEPIALAYAAAKAKEVLSANPEKIVARLSGNMIKNANSVKVPGTEGRKGIAISLAAGAFLGDASKTLQVLENLDKTRLPEMDAFIADGKVTVELVPGVPNLYIEVEEYCGSDVAKVVIEDSHTNITLIEKNKKEIFKKNCEKAEKEEKVDFSFEKIYDFAKNGNYDEIKPILDKEIEYNTAIAEEGMKNEWGSSIGRILLKNNPGSFSETMTAYAAAGSDARMSGCELPVVINSGSGNQGITVSVPIIMYAKEFQIEKEELYSALVFANLIGLYLKQRIGKLSAYCGVVSASSASIAGIAFLKKEDPEIIKATVSNSLAVNSGLICDGAKPSCAMKIASSLRNAILAYEQAKANKSFEPGDGIVMADIEKTIAAVSRIAKDGMKSTDEVILKEMIAAKNK